MEPEITQPQDNPNEPLLEAQLIQTRQIGEETNGLLEALIAQGNANNPEPLLEAQIVQADKNTDRLVEAFAPTGEAVSKMAAFLSEMKGEKGDKGETGERGETGPQGEQGPQGETGEQGPAGQDGQDGRDGTDGRDGRDGVDGRDGADGKDGKTPTIDYKKVVAETVKRIPALDIEKKVAEIAELISQRTNESVQSLRSTVASRTYALREMEDMQSASVGQVPVRQADGSWAPGDQTGGSGGSTYETPTGDIDGSNVTYTVSAVPKCIIYFGTTLFEGANGYSLSGLTVTMPYAPTVSDQFKAVI